MPEWKAGMKAKVPSGLGGIFIVKLIDRRTDGRWNLRIDMPGNPDFHGEKWSSAESDLQEVDHG